MPAANARAPRLLFVDDEAYLAHLGEAMLGRLGYEVSAYSEPEQALEAFLADPHAFAGLITDLNMPGMRGTDLAERMRRIRPDLPVILATGYSGPLELDRAALCGFPHVLEKPYNIEKLTEIVGRVMPTA
jgi:DNA-binding NtrC family response regulator